MIALGTIRLRAAFTAVAALLFFTGANAMLAQQDARTVVVLVRHAEKASATERDPVLSTAGTARALALAEALKDANVSAVITTQLQRTKLTGQPLAEKRGLITEVVATESSVESHARAVAEAVRKHAGSVVLVVGHSNTVPAIIAALGGPKMPDLCDSAYSNLFVVVLGEAGGARLIRSRFGEPDVAPDAACAAMTR